MLFAENLRKSLDLKATIYLYIYNVITESRSSCSCARRVWRRRRMTVCPAPCRDTGACTWFCRSCPPCTQHLQHGHFSGVKTEDPLWCLVPFALALDPHQPCTMNLFVSLQLQKEPDFYKNMSVIIFTYFHIGLHVAWWAYLMVALRHTHLSMSFGNLIQERT